VPFDIIEHVIQAENIHKYTQDRISLSFYSGKVFVIILEKMKAFGRDSIITDASIVAPEALLKKIGYQ